MQLEGLKLVKSYLCSEQGEKRPDRVGANSQGGKKRPDRIFIKSSTIAGQKPE